MASVKRLTFLFEACTLKTRACLVHSLQSDLDDVGEVNKIHIGVENLMKMYY